MKQFHAVKIETYPVPSVFRPVAFISRAKLPPDFDMVFSKNVHYPVEYVEIARSPWAARKAVKKRARQHLMDPLGTPPDKVKSSSGVLEPLLHADSLKRVLFGIDPMTPLLSNQKFWASMLSPECSLSLDNAGNNDVWRLLVAYNVPLILELGTKAQCDGMRILGLIHHEAPAIDEVRAKLLAASNWRVKTMHNEVEPHEFFALLASKQFPVIPRLRPLHAIFCGFEPDFWHEMVGHLAIITDPEYAEFYQWCGVLVEHVKDKPNSHKQLGDLFKLLWVILEYGIIKSASGELKAFGGALTSSYMALQRLKHGYIVTKPFEPRAVLRSGLADEFSVKRRMTKIQLFHITSLAQAKNILCRFTGLLAN